MRIKQISVTELFGIFNHVIPLNIEDRTTIIYGLNGIGKTAILRLINGIFNARYSEFRTIPFNNFQIDFDDGSNIRVGKTPQQRNLRRRNIVQPIIFFRESSNHEEKVYLVNALKTKDINSLDILIPGLERVSSITWRYLPTNELLDFKKVLERFRNDLPQEFQNVETPEWLKNIRDSIHIRFIESQRLLNLSTKQLLGVSESIRSSIDPIQPSMVFSVTTYAKELARNIEAKLANYGTLAQSLDRTFPARLVQQEVSTNLTDEELRKKLDRLEEKRTHLINAGLLDKDENQNFQIPEKIDVNTKNVLSVYVEDVEKKLHVFDDLAQKIELMKRIINQRFSYKQINFSKDKGFTFTCNGNSLSPEKLSSGEQHELVMLYELLFKVKPNSLILIDEPELSLHVEWQVNFLKDLREITEIAKIDVLLATHSPDIIHDRWDLTVELKGPQK